MREVFNILLASLEMCASVWMNTTNEECKIVLYITNPKSCVLAYCWDSFNWFGKYLLKEEEMLDAFDVYIIIIIIFKWWIPLDIFLAPWKLISYREKRSTKLSHFSTLTQREPCDDAAASAKSSEQETKIMTSLKEEAGTSTLYN